MNCEIISSSVGAGKQVYTCSLKHTELANYIPINLLVLMFKKKETGEIIIFKIFYFFIFREREREGERRNEMCGSFISHGFNQCVVASCAPPAGDLAYNSGMCPD